MVTLGIRLRGRRLEGDAVNTTRSCSHRFACRTTLKAIFVMAAMSQVAHSTTYNYTGANIGFFGANFQDAGNWSPAGGPPHNGDTATIEKPDVLLLGSSTATLNTLNVRKAAKLYTFSHVLNVSGGANGFTEVVDAGSQIVVQPSAFFSYVTDTLSLRLGGELKMLGGGALATFIIRTSVTGVISGYGTVGVTASAGTGLDSAGIIRPEGGDLNISVSQSLIDLDGNSAGMDLGGMLDVIYDGDLIVTGHLADPFSGRMDVGNNNRVEFSADFPTNGQINFTSGATNLLKAATLNFQSGAALTVQAADARLEGEITFNGATTIFLLNAADDLRLAGDTTIHPGAAFSGNGNVQIAAGSRMTLLNNAIVNVRVFNNDSGELTIGASAGAATVAGYTQSASSDLKIELGGVLPAEFDRLIVTGNSTLGGALDVSMLSGYLLTPGRSFEIMDVSGTRTGTFAGLIEGAKVGTFGKDLFITYAGGDGNDVVLFTKGFSADFDGDGDVDGADMLVWQRNVGKVNPKAGDGDADGDHDVDHADLVALQSQFGSKFPAVAALQAAPEPTGAVLLACAAPMALAMRRRARLEPGLLARVAARNSNARNWGRCPRAKPGAESDYRALDAGSAAPPAA